MSFFLIRRPGSLNPAFLAPWFACSLGPCLLEACFEQARLVFPEKLPAIHNLAISHVEEIDGQRSVLEVVSKATGDPAGQGVEDRARGLNGSSSCCSLKRSEPS